MCNNYLKANWNVGQSLRFYSKKFTRYSKTIPKLLINVVLGDCVLEGDGLNAIFISPDKSKPNILSTGIISDGNVEFALEGNLLYDYGKWEIQLILIRQDGGNTGSTSSIFYDVMQTAEGDGSPVVAPVETINTVTELLQALRDVIDEGNLAETDWTATVNEGSAADDNWNITITTGNDAQVQWQLTIDAGVAINTTLLQTISDANLLNTTLEGNIVDGNILNLSLANNITTGDILNTSLSANIALGTPLDISLAANIITGTALDGELDQNIIDGQILSDEIEGQILAGDLIQKGAGFDDAKYPFLKDVTNEVVANTEQIQSCLGYVSVGNLGIDFKFASIKWDIATSNYIKATATSGADAIAINCDTAEGLVYYDNRAKFPLGATDDLGNPFEDGHYYFLSQTVDGKFQQAKPTTGAWQPMFQVIKIDNELYAEIEIATHEDVTKIKFVKDTYIYEPTTEYMGKILSVLGDSITEAGYLSNPSVERFSNIVSKYFDFSSIVNYGVSGSKITECVTDDNSFVNRYSSVSDNTDILLVFGGTNDYGHTISVQGVNAPLGVFTDRTKNTFYGALHLMYQGLIEKLGQNKIIICTPMHRLGLFNVGDDLTENPDSNANLLDFVIAIREVAQYYGLWLLDLYSLSPNTIMNSVNTAYSIDGLHPNVLGHENLANLIISYMKNL